MKIQIKARFTDAIIFEADIPDDTPGREQTKRAVEIAAKYRADLFGADLSCSDLSCSDLSRADLSRADLSGSNLSGSNLSGADLSCSNLSGSNLSRADLSCSNLSGADLFGADLSGAYLFGSYLSGATLIGERPILQIGPLGSRAAYLVSFMTDAGVMVRAGCWYGSLEEFARRVSDVYDGATHGREYAAAIAMICAHADIWIPAKQAETA